MRVLLSDGTGLTARQSAGLLSEAGHEVEVLSPDPWCLCRFTRHVRRVHRVPAYGADPFGWLEAALDIAVRRRADLLLPTQEQVAVLAKAADRLDAAGVRTVVPGFAALAQVQDKLAAFATLTRLGLPQPPASVVTGRRELESYDTLPVFVKTPIGTASTGVCRVSTSGELRRLAARHDEDGVFAAGGVLAQRPVSGPLVMAQSVFAHGELVAFHTCERVREGARGGASHKRGLDLPAVRGHVAALGGALGWHGALSADVILAPDGPSFIDVNPRLVEPANASRSGVDLLGALLEIARTGGAAPQRRARPGSRDAPVAARGPRRGPARRPPPRGRPGAAYRAGLRPYRRTDAPAPRPPQRRPRRRRRARDPHPAERVAALHLRQRRGLLPHPRRLAPDRGLPLTPECAEPGGRRPPGSAAVRYQPWRPAPYG